MTFRGRDEFSHFMMGFKQAFPDMVIRHKNVVTKGSKVAVEFTASGTHTGSLQTPNGLVPATNQWQPARQVLSPTLHFPCSTYTLCMLYLSFIHALSTLYVRLSCTVSCTEKTLQVATVYPNLVLQFLFPVKFRAMILIHLMENVANSANSADTFFAGPEFFYYCFVD
jgi:hypothetical protein